MVITYKGPTIKHDRPSSFDSERSFVDYVESQAEKVCGPYAKKEQEVKIAALGSKRRLNRVFDSMGAYGDRPFLEDKAGDDTEGRKLAPTQKSRRASQVAGKRRVRDPEDVRIGHDLAKPVETEWPKGFFLSW
jgi:hypothetical protein